MLLISPVQSFVPEQCSAVNVPRKTLSFRSDPLGHHFHFEVCLYLKVLF